MKYIIFDVDGTLTDGKIYIGNDGEMMKSFDVKDGYGIHNRMPACGLVPVIITARESRIVENRCKELGISRLYQGCRDKAAKLEELAEELGIRKNPQGVYEEAAYMGDDLADLPVMRLCGKKGCPGDAVDGVKKEADFIAVHNGGDGAAREFIEWVIETRFAGCGKKSFSGDKEDRNGSL